MNDAVEFVLFVEHCERFDGADDRLALFITLAVHGLRIAVGKKDHSVFDAVDEHHVTVTPTRFARALFKADEDVPHMRILRCDRRQGFLQTVFFGGIRGDLAAAGSHLFVLIDVESPVSVAADVFRIDAEHHKLPVHVFSALAFKRLDARRLFCFFIGFFSSVIRIF